MDISLKCNPFKKENIIYHNGKQYDSNSKLYKYKDKYVYELKEEFIEDIFDELNVRNIDIKFTGSRYDFENLSILAKTFNCENENKVNFIEDNILETLDRREELEDLVKLVEESEFDDDKKLELTEPIKKALNEEVQVAIVATMSAGKSTLINAIVGEKIMPSSPLACTANIVNLKNNNNLDRYKITKINYIDEERFIDLDGMEELKNNSKVKTIDLEGKIEGLKNIKNLVLVDTPGANNARNIEHKKTTMDFIKSNKKPIILFILNAEDLFSDDEAQLLEIISREIKREDERIDEERFIFVVNRAEKLNKQNYIEEAVERVKGGLREIGIKSPRIHYVSAYNSMISRIEEDDLDIDEEDDLEVLLKRIEKRYKDDRFIQYHRYSTLSQKIRLKLNDELNKAILNEDFKTASIILSGIKGLEMSILEIVDKYKNVNLVEDAVSEINRKIKKQEIKEKIQEQLINKKEEKEVLKKNIDEVLKVIESSVIKNEIEEEIKNIEFPESIKQIMVSISKDINKLIKDIHKLDKRVIDGKDMIERDTAEKYLNKLKNKVGDLSADLNSEYDRYIRDEIHTKGKSIVERYKKHILVILDEITSFENIQIACYIAQSIPNIDKFIEKNNKVKKVENPKKRWWKIFTRRYIYENFIEFNEISDFTQKILKESLENIELIKENTEGYKDELINNLNQIVNDIELKVKESINELNKLSEEKELLEVAITLDTSLIDTIDEYKIRLEKIMNF